MDLIKMNINRFKEAALCFLVIPASLALFACGGEDVSEPETDTEPRLETAAEETPSDYSEESGEYDNYDNYDQLGSTSALPKVTSVSIATISNNLRDGFKANVETDTNTRGDIDFIYEWKLNGEPITAETGEVLEWRDEFKKGDNLSIAVVPVNAIGEGVWAAEGGIVIPNSPPKIISEPVALFDSGEFSYTVEAEDPDGDSFDYTLRGAPRGMTIEPATGLITWQYGAQDAGDYEVSIIVTDSEGAESVQILTFTIHGEGEAP